MKKKLSLNKLKIASMDANEMRAVRGGATFDGWNTYEAGCTMESYAYGCTEGEECNNGSIIPQYCGPDTDYNECGPGHTQGEGCLTPQCLGQTMHPNCPTEGCNTVTHTC